ncbi:MAG: hypothetical protein ACJ72A_08370 [Nocardioidaceae bacterium]
MTTTSVLCEADAQEFAAAYPRSEERPEAPDCNDLWVRYDVAAGWSTSTSRVKICT